MSWLAAWIFDRERGKRQGACYKAIAVQEELMKKIGNKEHTLGRGLDDLI